MKKIIYICFVCISFVSHAQLVQTTIVSNLYVPVAFDWMPNGNYLITLKDSGIKVYSPNGTFISSFYDLSDSAAIGSECGVLGVCVDPNFSTNHFVYVYYVHHLVDTRIRIVRFTEVSNTGTNPVLILDNVVPFLNFNNHVGGNVHMHASEPDKLYCSIGDFYWDSLAQLLTNPYGKILRINTDGTIPTDNPFYDDGNPATGNDDRIWSYGHRNQFDFCFSPVNDSLYCTENGLNTWDEVNQIHPGSNYGWNICEGNYLYSSTTIPCTNPSLTLPITEWGSIDQPAPTGICIYSGNVIPQLNNHMLVAGIKPGKTYNCTLTNPPAYDSVASNVLWSAATNLWGLTTIKEGIDGCIYVLNGGITDSGKIYRICPANLYVNEYIPSIAEASIFPNPSCENAEIRFILNDDKQLNIFISDLSGRKISELADRIFLRGNQVLKIDNSNLVAGTYFCYVKALKENKVILMSIVR